MSYSIEDLKHLMARLRDPDTGCPWDTKQTFASIVPHTIEEAYEVADAIEQEDDWYTLGQLGQFITAANPDFDTRSYGRRKLSDLIADIKILESKRGPGNQLMVRRLD